MALGNNIPLAERIRPATLDDYIESLKNPNKNDSMTTSGRLILSAREG